jgi:hypothetical protein
MRVHKLPLTAIHELRRALDESPECEATEVNALRAVELLAPHIRAMQSKGYSLDDVARMFAAKGAPITAKTLSTYLTKCAGASEAKRSRSRKRQSAASRAKPETSSKPIPKAIRGAQRAPAAERGAQAGHHTVGNENATPAPTGAPLSATSAPSTAPPAQPTGQHRTIYSGFTPRPDTEDI